MVLLGIIEFLSMYLALLYLSNISLNLKNLTLSICIILIPALVGHFFLSPIVGILLLLFIMTYLFYLLSKSKWILIDVCVVSIIGIFADNTAQLINRFVLVIDESLELHIIWFLGVFLMLIIAYQYLCRKNFVHIQFSFTNQFFVFALIVVTVAIFYLNVFIFDSGLLLKINLPLQLTYILLITLFFVVLIKATKKEHMLKEKEIMQLIQVITRNH